MFTAAIAHLRGNDPILREVIDHSPLPGFAPHTDYYRELTSSIIGQQLSVRAAASINKRFIELFNSFPSPEQIMTKSIDELRTAGLSAAKARYVQDLAQHIVDGRLSFENFDTLSNDSITETLTQVKGIGEWTAHMFLMFCMGRQDVLPVGDLGIRSGIKILYNLPSLPTPDEVRKIAKEYHWHPYESVASWYVWHALDNAPKR